MLPDRPGDAPARRHDRVVLAADAALAPGLDLRLPHPRGRLDGRAGARVHAQGRPDLRRAGRRARPRRRRLRAAAVASSSTRRSTSSRRSPSTAPRGASGRASCATPSAPRDPQVVADALPHADRRRVADRPAAAQQHRRARRSRRWPACSAARSRCTPTPTTRRSRCRPRRPCGSRCAPSRSSPTRPASTNTIDPLGGSYFVEALTDEMEAQAYDYFAQIDELGGMVEAVKRNFPQREIADAALELQQRDRRTGGGSSSASTRYTEGDDDQTPILQHRPGARAQADRPRPGGPRAAATPATVEAALAVLKRGGRDRASTSCRTCSTRAGARHRRRDRRRRSSSVFGDYTETPVF